MRDVLDVLSAICLLAGSFLSMVAGIGLVRLPDLFTRMHAATKPQTAGLLFLLVGLGLRLDSWRPVGLLVLVAVFQLMTAPVAAHMMGRRAIRATRVDSSRFVVDDLSDH